MTTTADWPYPIYLSGPMFDPGDLAEQRTIAALLELAPPAPHPVTGIVPPLLAPIPTNPSHPPATCYLPQRDGIEVGDVMAMLNSPVLQSPHAPQAMRIVRKMVFALDVYQVLERCGALVFTMDGRVPDDGSVVEAAAAYTAGRVVLTYKNTPITMLGGFDNPMVSGLSSTWDQVTDMTEIPTALLARIRSHTTCTTTFCPSVQTDIDDGAWVWSHMADIRTMQAELGRVTGGHAALQAMSSSLGAGPQQQIDELLRGFIAWASPRFT